jgi:flagellar basal-body rod modification protein FlgD
MSVTAFSPDVASSLSSAAGTSTASSSTGAMASKEVFLQLLVAQIKNQNPLNPTDGVEFMSQLAQFSQLEQTMSIGEDLSAIRSKLETSTSTTPTTPTTEP